MLKKFLYQRQMSGRDPNESGRVATPLELLFDLVYVVAIAAAASGLHHALAHHHIGAGLASYGLGFFCIWWAWMNFTWFASAFDTDDVSFRLAAMVQMFGSLVFAAGVPSFFSEEPSLKIAFIGFVVMRLALAYQWLRAAHDAPKYRATAIAYAVGIVIMQVLWGLFLLLPSEYFFSVGAILVLGELSVPFIAERVFGRTPWHHHHISERYGLLVIIVLGEGVLGSLNSGAALATSDILSACVIGFGGILVVFMLWWFYFDMSSAGHLYHQDFSAKHVFFVAYAHYFAFAAMASVGASLELVADSLKHDSHVSALYAIIALNISVTLSVFFTMLIGLRAGAYDKFKLSFFAILALGVLGVLATALTSSVAVGIWLSAALPVAVVLILKSSNKGANSHHA